MNTRVKYFVAGIVILILLLGSGSAGFIIGNTYHTLSNSVNLFNPPSVTTSSGSGTTTGTQLNKDQLFVPFWQTWDLIHQEFYKQPVDDVALMRGAIKGLLDALGDKHTSYIDPQTLTQFNAQIQGENYEGIGAWVDPTAKYLTVISPMTGSPAEKAGLKTGDQIVAIDGKDMTGIDGELVRQKVVGPAGTTVRLTIQRPGLEQTFDVSIVRAKITSSNIIAKMLDNHVAYVQILAFGDQKTLDDLRASLNKLLAEKPVGLILDLRYNGGGLLDSAVDVASEFIGKGVIVYEVAGNGTRQTYNAKPGGVATDIPMVVLVNEGSASASEIVAGALQDYGRARLVGMKTYGKGSVQIWTNLLDNQGAVRITIARWLTPKERSINDVGLTPDYVIPITDADKTAAKDPQLDQAIQLLVQNPK